MAMRVNDAAMKAGCVRVGMINQDVGKQESQVKM